MDVRVGPIIALRWFDSHVLTSSSGKGPAYGENELLIVKTM